MQDLSYKSALISNMLIGGRVSKALIMVIYIEDVQAHLRRSGCRSGVPLDPGLNLLSTLNRLQSHDITRLTPISCLENDSHGTEVQVQLRGSLHAVFSFSLGRTSHCPWKFFDDRGAVAQRCRKITKAFRQAAKQQTQITSSKNCV